MNFASTFGADYLTLNPDIVFGTAMLGRQFGTVKSAAVKRTGLREEIINDAGELLLLLIKNPGWELMLSCAFDRTVSPPGLLERITLPFLGVQGHVMEGATIQWEGGSERIITIPVNSWDTAQVATAYRLEPGSGRRIEIGRAGVAPTAAPTLTQLGITSQSVTLGIGVVAGAEKYRLEWSSDGINWTLAEITPLNYLTQTGLGPRTTRHYRAAGMDGEARGPWSQVLTITTAAADAAPSAAPAIKALHLVDRTRFTWTAVANAEDYEIEWRTDSIVPWEPLTTTTGLTNTLGPRVLDDYRGFRVRARNSLGNGPWATLTTRLFAQPVITAQAQTRTAASWRFIAEGTVYRAGLKIRWSTSPDMFNAVELPFAGAGANFLGAGQQITLPEGSIPPLGVRIFWQAKHTDSYQQETEWGAIKSTYSLPRTPTDLSYGGEFGDSPSWTNPGGQLEGWRIYKQSGTGPLQLHTQHSMPSTLPVSVTYIDRLDPWIVGRKFYVVSVHNGLESPLPAALEQP